MEKSSKRVRQVADLIQCNLALIIQREVSDPRLNDLSITGVEVSPDLGTAKVFYTVYNKEHLDEVKKVLEKASGFLRHLLAEATTLRYTPQLRFVYDESILYGEKLSALIDSAAKVDPENPAE